MSDTFQTLPVYIARCSRSLDDFLDSSISDLPCTVYCQCNENDLDDYQWKRLVLTGTSEINFFSGARYSRKRKEESFEKTQNSNCGYSIKELEDSDGEPTTSYLWKRVI